MVYGNKKSINDDLKRKKTNFKRIFPGFKKKAIELSVLCDNCESSVGFMVGFIVYGPDKNDLHVWPEPQENPEAIPEIVDKFNRMNDEKRKNKACDLYDYPDVKGLSVDELKIHLSKIDSHLLEIRRRKIAILSKTGISMSDQKLKALMVSEDEKMGLWENPRGSKLGFGDGFDELGNMVRGSTSKNVCYFESQSQEDYQTHAICDVGVSCDDLVWDSELFSTLPPLVTLPDSSTTNTSLSNTLCYGPI